VATCVRAAAIAAAATSAGNAPEAAATGDTITFSGLSAIFFMGEKDDIL
jgi:hypothetical protein